MWAVERARSGCWRTWHDYRQMVVEPSVAYLTIEELR